MNFEFLYTLVLILLMTFFLIKEVFESAVIVFAVLAVKYTYALIVEKKLW